MVFIYPLVFSSETSKLDLFQQYICASLLSTTSNPSALLTSVIDMFASHFHWPGSLTKLDISETKIKLT
jgi:hypothetical protein